MIAIDINKTLDAANGKMELEFKHQFTEGSFTALYGPSGAGKTSTLRMLAGLMTPDKGQIIVGEKKWFERNSKINLKSQKRNIGFVFQDYALFPNMTVLENLIFSNHKNDLDFINELINITELGSLKNTYPEKLSGGQQQRVALARAAAQQPDILLLDEPLSAIDAELRIKLQTYIKEIHQRYDLTTIMISHDIKEILSLADNCVVLQDGKIIKSDDPSKIFFEKTNSKTNELIGKIVHIEITPENGILTLDIQSNLTRVNVSIEKARNSKIGESIGFDLK